MLLYYIVTSPMNQTESRQQLTTCLNNQTKTKFLIFIKNKQLSLCCSLSSFYFSKKRGFLLSCLVIRVQRPIVSNKKWWSINWILFRMNSFGAAGYHKLLGINSVINVVFLKKKKQLFLYPEIWNLVEKNIVLLLKIYFSFLLLLIFILPFLCNLPALFSEIFNFQFLYRSINWTVVEALEGKLFMFFLTFLLFSHHYPL